MTTFEDISKAHLQGNICIVGDPGCGKTSLSKNLAVTHPNHTVIHTDAFAFPDYQSGLYTLMETIKKHKGPTIIEGVMGMRLLRKGAQTGEYYPDVVIEVTAPEESVRRTYEKERTERQYKLDGIRKANKTIYKDYKNLPLKKSPIWITVDNPY